MLCYFLLVLLLFLFTFYCWLLLYTTVTQFFSIILRFYLCSWEKKLQTHQCVFNNMYVLYITGSELKGQRELRQEEKDVWVEDDVNKNNNKNKKSSCLHNICVYIHIHKMKNTSNIIKNNERTNCILLQYE